MVSRRSYKPDRILDHLKGRFNLRNAEKIVMEKTLEEVLVLKAACSFPFYIVVRKRERK